MEYYSQKPDVLCQPLCYYVGQNIHSVKFEQEYCGGSGVWTGGQQGGGGGGGGGGCAHSLNFVHFSDSARVLPAGLTKFTQVHVTAR